MSKGVEWEMAVLRGWPRHLSLEEHFALEVARYERAADAVEGADAVLAMKMIRLADTEPAIRTAWLMACDQVEREMTGVIAKRLGRPAGDLAVRMRGAAASAAFRVVNEGIGAALLGGAEPREFADVSRRLARAVRDAAGSDIGDALPLL
ncbi:hypothetical protein [Streptomyces phaeochromogenes]|uniref:acyl-CoA-like ligand-binding transcription factor n=1 Tax=Streptomyces phaeochromogenes TaxID=1923 RepID=UPI00340559AA